MLMNIERLKKLRLVMTQVDADERLRQRFNMCFWFGQITQRWADESPRIITVYERQDKPPQLWTDCGTAGCALGWWSTSLEARNDGWRHTEYRLGDPPQLIFGHPSWGSGISLYDSAREYFGLNNFGLDYLFMPNNYDETVIRPDSVIEHIDNLLLGLAPVSCYADERMETENAD